MNYIGSKYTLLDFLQRTIDEVTGLHPSDGYVFSDLFAGTGVVGSKYRERGCRVIANDIQYYSYVLNKHLLENRPPMDRSLLDHLNTLQGIEGFVFHHYCSNSKNKRNYFTASNGMRCDAIRQELNRLLHSGEIDESTFFWYLASLIHSIDKYANTASVYGAFLKHTKASARKDFQLELLPIIEGTKGSVYNEDVNTLVKKVSGDVLYLDPPYNARQYCTNYHVLETIARYDNPLLTGKTGLRNYKNQKSRYCSSKTVASAFEELISNAEYKYIFLSYSNEGLMDFDAIKRIMEKYGDYSRVTQEYRRFKADRDENRRIVANSTLEYLHCLIKK